MVVGGFAVSFTQMEFNCVIARKCPTAELTFELGINVLLHDDSLCGSGAEGLREFWLLYLGLVFYWHFAHVFDLEPEMGLQVGNECGRRPKLRRAVITVEDRVTCVHILQKFGPSGFPQLVFYICQPMAYGGH